MKIYIADQMKINQAEQLTYNYPVSRDEKRMRKQQETALISETFYCPIRKQVYVAMLILSSKENTFSISTVN